MRLRSFVCLAACAAAFAWTSSAKDFKGRVLLPDGKPAGAGFVANAGPMAADPGDRPAATAPVGPDGRFALSVAGDAGEQLWIADPAGRARIGWPHLGASRDFGDIRLPADGALGGQLVGPDGVAVRGVRVLLLRRLDASCTHYVESGSVAAGDDGSFLFEPVPRGDHACRVDSDDFAPEMHEIRVAADSYLEIHLKKSAVLAGHVFGPAGPVAGVGVTVSGARAPIRTDAGGGFVVRGLAAGPHTVGVRSAGWTTRPQARLSVTTRSGETVTCRVDVVRSGALRIALKRLDPAVRLPDRMAFRMGPPGRPSVMPELDGLEADLTNGVALLRDLPPGRYEIRPEGSEWGPVSTQVVVVSERETEAVLAMPKTRTLSVLVVDAAGKPVEGASVRTEVKRPGAEDDSSSTYLRTDENGRAERPGLTEGRVTVEVDDEKNLPEKREWDVATLAGEQKIVLRAGVALRGSVADEAGRPLDGVDVTVRISAPATNAAAAGTTQARLPDPFDAAFLVRREAKTEGGRFVVSGLAVGTAWIEIDSGEHEPLTEEFDLGPAPADRTYRLKKAGVIAGRVIEDGKAPAADLSIVAQGPEPDAGTADENPRYLRRETKTGPDGSFRLAGLPAGRYQLSVSRPDRFGESEAEREGVAAGSTNVLIELARMIEVPVLVLGPDERPVPGATLAGNKLDQGRHESYVTRWFVNGEEETPKTDAQGRGTVRARQGGKLAVTASKPPWIDGRAVVDLGRGRPGTNVVLRLTAGLRLEGRVMDPAGRPASGLRVRSDPSPAPTGDGEDPAGGTTDAEGRFRLEGLPVGSVRVAVFPGSEDDSSGPMLMETVVLRREGRSRPVEFRLPASGGLNGMVRGTNGAPVARAYVILMPAGDGDGIGNRTEEADGDGRFSFAHVPAGEYRLLWVDPVRRDSPPPKPMPVAIRAGEIATITCSPAADNRPLRKGRVLVSGRPATGARVALTPELPEGVDPGSLTSEAWGDMVGDTFSGTTDTNGCFEARLGKPGRYVVFADVRGPGRTPLRYAMVEEIGADDRDLVLRFDGVTVRGVARAVDGRPRPAVDVMLAPELMPENGNPYTRQMLARSAETDKGGAFAFDAVPPGTYVLRASDESGYAIRPGLVIGKQDVAVDLQTQPGVRVHGSVRLAGGDPAPQAVVMAVSQRSIYESGLQPVDDEGKYDFTPPLRPGRYHVLAWLDGFAVECRDVDVHKETSLDWVLQEGGALDVRLEGPEAKRGGRVLHLLGPEGREVLRPRGAFTPCPPGVALRPTNAEGRARIAGLLPGRYEVGVQGSAARAPAEVKPGVVSEVRIAVE